MYRNPRDSQWEGSMGEILGHGNLHAKTAASHTLTMAGRQRVQPMARVASDVVLKVTV